MAATRADHYRLVTIQDGHEFVSTDALSEDDAESMLAIDTLLHRAAGWSVVEGPSVMLASRGNVTRLVRARSVRTPTQPGIPHLV
jgi:hypothetical protein